MIRSSFVNQYPVSKISFLYYIQKCASFNYLFSGNTQPSIKIELSFIDSRLVAAFRLNHIDENQLGHVKPYVSN